MDLVRVGIYASTTFDVNLLANLMGFIIRGLIFETSCQNSDWTCKVHYVDSYIAEKSQWCQIDSAHSYTRSNQGVLRFFQSTMLAKQLVILGIRRGKR